MSNYNSLKTTIDANIKQNGNQEITGQILNSVLNQMVNTLGAGYQFAGVATTATNPGSPDAKVFYISNGKGTYTNFGSLQVTEDDVVVLYWDSSWHKVSTGIASQAKLSEIEGKTDNIETEDVYENSDEIVIKDNDGTEVAKINADGADFKNLKSNGDAVARVSDLADYARRDEIPQTEQAEDFDDAIIVNDKNGNPLAKISPEKCDFKNLHNNGVPVGTESILSGKSVAFDGDSICYGASDTQGRGWASRIGIRNSMSWYNYAVSGATIATGTGKSHNLSQYIDTIISSHPTLDYLILEGGTNDADLLGSGGMGIFAEYAFDGSFSTTDFYGALDTLFFKAISAYPNTKIGFIIAPKMSARNPSMSGSATKLRRDYFNAVIKACKKWGIPYIDLWEISPLNPCLDAYYHNNTEMTSEENKQENISQGKAYADGQHPTYVGYDILSSQIENWMKTL